MKGVSSSNGILNPDWFQTSTSNGISSKSNTRTESRDENIDKDWQSDVVHNKLTSYIQKTANNFLKQPELENRIGEKFKAQLKSLENCYWHLLIDVKNFNNLEEDKKIALGGAIAKINGLVCRLNNKSVGGINKSQADQFQKSTMCLIRDKKRYESAKAMVKSEDPLERRQGKELMKKCEDHAANNKNVVEGNLQALGENLKLLESFSKSPASGRGNIEKMLNLIQQCCLNAWVFNDVAKSLEGTGYLEDSLKNLGILSEENKEMRKLNNAARDTTMFKEFQINKLIENAKLTETGSDNEGVADFLNKWGEEKIGFRGRHGVDENDERVSSKPIGNTKNEKNVLQNGSLFKDKEFTSSAGNIVAIKGSIVPDETANLKTVPSEMLKDLEGIMNTVTGKEIVRLLQDENLIKAEKDSSGKFSKITAKPSFASYINDAGLPTYCSVSGTTGETVSVLHCTLKDGNGNSLLTEVFENLLKIADGIWPEPPFNFSRYFAPIATFMEVGHFHTTGEVLGGFLSVAVAERNVKNEAKIRLSGGDEEKIKQEIEQTKEDASEFRFKNLLNYFNCHQELFLAPVGEEPVQVWTTVVPGNAMRA